MSAELGRTRGGPTERPHRPFTLVLSGGGARGFAHVGVLRSLESSGYRPDAIVGVSMGAVVGATYALRLDWYRALVDMATDQLAGPHHTPGDGELSLSAKVRALFSYPHVAWDMYFGWGVGIHSLTAGTDILRTLTGDRDLEDGRVPIAVCATDLLAGERVVMRQGPAAEAMYASSALAGVLPPLQHGGRLLADGVYADIAPIDVARELGPPTVIAVDAGQSVPSPAIRNGFQALMRAVEICHQHHARLRFDEADLVLRPEFIKAIDTLDFSAKRECIASGLRAVRINRARLRDVLVVKDRRRRV